MEISSNGFFLKTATQLWKSKLIVSLPKIAQRSTLFTLSLATYLKKKKKKNPSESSKEQWHTPPPLSQTLPRQSSAPKHKAETGVRSHHVSSLPSSDGGRGRDRVEITEGGGTV